jgi:hypothetical protein
MWYPWFKLLVLCSSRLCVPCYFSLHLIFPQFSFILVPVRSLWWVHWKPNEAKTDQAKREEAVKRRDCPFFHYPFFPFLESLFKDYLWVNFDLFFFLNFAWNILQFVIKNKNSAIELLYLSVLFVRSALLEQVLRRIFGPKKEHATGGWKIV